MQQFQAWAMRSPLAGRLASALVVALCLLSTVGCTGSISSLIRLSDSINLPSSRGLAEDQVARSTHTLGAFDEIKLSTNIDCHFYQSNEPRITIIAPNEERLKDLHFAIESGELVIYDNALKGGYKLSKEERERLKNKLAIDIYAPTPRDFELSGANTLHFATPITVDELAIDGSGACNITGLELTARKLELDFSGAVEMQGKNLVLRELSVEASGATELELAGTAETIEVDGSGAVELELKDLLAKQVQLDLSGSSDVTVFASERLVCDASGTASVDYYGNPKDVRANKSGMATITAK